MVGTQNLFFDFTRVSGDDLNGVYTAIATMPQGSKVGFWYIGNVYLVDALNNSACINADELQVMFPDIENPAIANTALASSVTIEREWIIKSETATVTFPANTVVTKNEGGRFAFYKMVNQEFNVDSLPDINLSGDPVLTIKLGVPGINLDFSQNVTVSLHVGADYSDEVLMIQALSEGGDAWANETACTVLVGSCTFTVNHASYFTAVLQDQKKIVVSTKAPDMPMISIWNASGTQELFIRPFEDSFRGGVTAAMGDLNGDGKDEVVAVPYSAGGPQVKIFNSERVLKASVFPYSTSYRGGLSLALGDVDNDGKLEIIVAPSTGGGPQVRVYDYAKGRLTRHSQWFAYAKGLRTGITVQTGDTDGDGKDEIITTINTGATPHVRVFSDKGKVEGQFYAFSKSFRGGVNATIADINADGKADIVVSPKAAGSPRVKVFRPRGYLKVQFFAYPSDKRLGVKTGVGDVDNNGNVEIVTAPQSGKPQIKVFKTTGKLKDSFLAYNKTFKAGVELVVGNVDTDKTDEIITAPRIDGGPNVKIFNNIKTHKAKSFMGLDSWFRGGVNLALSQ